MTKKSGTSYETKAKNLLWKKYNIYSQGLNPRASPDLVVPFNIEIIKKYDISGIGLEVKSTKYTLFRPSSNQEQYEYLKNRFPVEWSGYIPYYMVYFFKSHEWEIYPIDAKTPYRMNEGIKIDEFIEKIRVDPAFKWIKKIETGETDE